MRSPSLCLLLVGALSFGCDSSPPFAPGPDGSAEDAAIDAGLGDGGASDAGIGDASTGDAGSCRCGPCRCGPGDAGSDDAGVDAGTAAAIDALFVGNSYTDSNNLPVMVQQALESLSMPPASLTLNRATGGGRRLTQHAADAITDGHALEAALSEGTLTHVILQEQSQIPGFGDGNGELELSKTAASELGGLAHARGAQVVMYVTWGRRDGDDRNPGLYPDFLTMQTRLDAGYATLAAQVEMAGADVVMAPVGPAFRVIHEGATGDPLDPSALFYRLYSGDGSHPSASGTYLAACVFVGALLGVSPTDITFAPDSIDPADVALLQQAAGLALDAR